MTDPGALVTALRAFRARWLDHSRSFFAAADPRRRLVEDIADELDALLASEATTREGAEPDAHHVLLYRKLERAVNALDPAAADDKLREEWVAAKWNVFNAAVWLVKDAALPAVQAQPEAEKKAR